MYMYNTVVTYVHYTVKSGHLMVYLMVCLHDRQYAELKSTNIVCIHATYDHHQINTRTHQYPDLVPNRQM